MKFGEEVVLTILGEMSDEKVVCIPGETKKLDSSDDGQCSTNLHAL